MNATRAAENVVVTAGGEGVVSHVGAHLLASLADALGLTAAFGEAMATTVERSTALDRGRLLTQVAVSLATGGVCVSDLAVLRNQPALFGEVASGPTIWRALDSVDEVVLASLREARASARERSWAAGGAPDEVVIDIDASLVEIHSEHKEQAGSHYKGGYGFHPMFAYLDGTDEALAGILRRGNAAANDAADHITVVDLALDQLPEEHRAGHLPGDDPSLVRHPILVRADSAGATKAFVAACVERNVEFSVTARASGAFADGIRDLGDEAWLAARGQDGAEREGAFVSELVTVNLSAWPPGTRALVRRERAHPGAQLKLWDHDGWRHQVVLTNQSGDFVQLEARHRGHARVEDRIKAAKACGLERMPFRSFAANAAWLELVLTGCDLLAWLRLHALDGELALAEPKRLRYTLLHAAARLVRRARRVVVRVPDAWPWATDLVVAYERVGRLAA